MRQRDFPRPRFVIFGKTATFTSAPTQQARAYLALSTCCSFCPVQLLSLRDALRQRDNEIAILVNMLKQVFSVGLHRLSTKLVRFAQHWNSS